MTLPPRGVAGKIFLIAKLMIFAARYESASVCMGLILGSLKDIEFAIKNFPADPKKRFFESIEELNKKALNDYKKEIENENNCK